MTHVFNLKQHFTQWVLADGSGLWIQYGVKLEEWSSVKKQELLVLFAAASLIVSACVRQSLFEGQGLSLGIHTQGSLQLGCLRNLKAMQLCNLHTKWSGLIQNKPLNFKCGGGEGGRIIASFSELIG